MKRLLCIFMIISLLFAVAGCSGEDAVSKEVAAKGDVAYFAALADDEIKEKYEDKYIEVTGVVSYAGGTLVYVGSLKENMTFHCYFDDDDATKDVEKDKILTVCGKVSSAYGKTVTLKSCKIISCTEPEEIENTSEDTTSNIVDTNSSDSSSSNVTNNGSKPSSSKPSASQTASSKPAETTKPNNTHTHSFSKASCTEPKTCSGCGATEGNPKGHSWKDATYDNPKTCTECGLTEGAAKEVPNKENYRGHVYTGGSYSERFHYEADCAGSKSHEITWEEVSRRGLTACKTCVEK